MDQPKRFALFEPQVREFITGFDRIAAAAGYGSDYFRKRYINVPASKQVVSSGVLSCHTGLGHYYLCRNVPITHPTSAAAWGENIRAMIEQERRASVPGWYGPTACPVSARSALFPLS